ncbi:MAG TPA: SPFH domain-containing protein, partial [Thermoanaerobaculia bacterium]|nr:SPFH domain-containing protein [Thermoanaerobaculia bacterium]
NINSQVVQEVDKASESWGVKVLRYEIKNITPPKDVLAAMEKQMRAEREKRAVILQSEGQRDAAINAAEGDKQQAIKASEAKRQKQINEAEGEAQAILSVAAATAAGLRKVADAIQTPGGMDALQLRVAEAYVEKFGEMAKAGTTMILPANLADVGSMITLAMSAIKGPAAGDAKARIPVREANRPFAQE